MLYCPCMFLDKEDEYNPPNKKVSSKNFFVKETSQSGTQRCLSYSIIKTRPLRYFNHSRGFQSHFSYKRRQINFDCPWRYQSPSYKWRKSDFDHFKIQHHSCSKVKKAWVPKGTRPSNMATYDLGPKFNAKSSSRKVYFWFYTNVWHLTKRKWHITNLDDCS